MFNYTKLPLLIIISILCTSLYASPSWYNNRTYTSKDRTFYGYGQARNEKTARANALREIAEQINSDVSSSIRMQTTSINKHITQNIDSSTFISTKQTLSDTKIIKISYEKNQVYILMKHIYTEPFWYSSRSFDAPLFNIIGYGIGLSMDEALLDARNDISSQMNSNIDSSTSIEITQDNASTSINTQSKIKSTSKAILKNSTVIKSEKVAKNYFVAIIHKKAPQLECIDTQNPFLQNIELIKKANALTPCLYHYDLVRIGSSWHLYSDGFSQELNYSQFDNFFTSMNSNTLKISSKYSSYQSDDLFNLEILSKEDGYLSIIAVYENGKVGVMLENKSIHKDSIEVFPSKESNLELIAGLNEKNQATKDLYFAFVSKTKINLAKFDTITDKLLGEKEYRFNQVIKMCSDYNFATVLLRTSPKTRVKRFENISQLKSDTTFSWFFNDQLKSTLEDLPQKEKDSRKWAFIISIENYEFSDSIKYANNSGDIFKLLVSKKLNIEDEHIVYLKNSEADAKSIISNLEDITKKIKQNDTLYFYFVGQGVPDPKQDNEPYLLAYNKSLGNFAKDRQLKLSNIYKILSSSKAKKTFVFLDTTFSGATDGVSVFKGVAAPKLKPKRVKVDKKISSFIAGRDTEFTNKYNKKRHRMFTYFLIDAILNQNIQETQQLFEYIKTNVSNTSFELGDEYIQTPIFRGNIHSNL